MANTVDDAIQEIQEQIAAITGIREAPQYIRDNMGNAFPFVVAYPDNGELKMEPVGSMTGLHNIMLEFHVARKDLEHDVKTAYPFIDSIPDKIFSALSAGSFSAIQTFGGNDGARIGYEFTPLSWGGQETIGFIFTIYDVKIRAGISS